MIGVEKFFNNRENVFGIDRNSSFFRHLSYKFKVCSCSCDHGPWTIDHDLSPFTIGLQYYNPHSNEIEFARLTAGK